MGDRKSKKLTFSLTDEQRRILQPLIEETGRIRVAGTIEDDELRVSFIACNAPFIACNAAFIACNAPFRIESLPSA
jgi:hypothetical protein